MTVPVRTTCPYCGVGCGVLATPQANGTVTVKGDPDHPANLGRLCSKGSALGETVDLGGRLLYPQINGERASWDAALDLVAGKFREVIDTHGPEAVAFYVSGQILTEDYYVANKLMKGYIGAANIDTNSRLCMASSVAGHKRAFGTDTVPCSYEDLELADLLVLVGSNAAWCHPVLWQRMLAARRQRPGMKIVVVDPRRTATAEDADLFLPIRPGSDVTLFNGLLSAPRGQARSRLSR
jgi:assimilatory nitrate reductase catalytic subunit